MSGGRRKSLYELSLSLVLSLWCLFLFHPHFGHGHGNRDSHVGSKGNNRLCTGMQLESYFFSIHRNSSTSYCSRGPRNLIKGINKVEEAPDAENERISEPKVHQQENIEEKHYPIKDKTEPSTEFNNIGLDEFRNLMMQRKENDTHKLLVKIIHRLEPGGAEYNYASSAKGAKVLAHNKEAKGVGDILSRDKDKYLRNRCSTNEKFVVIELSEETLVDAIEIANLEHYSSNFKDFELLGSLSYPTETWTFLGTFTAENVKHAQRFMLSEPKWTRYMRLNLVSHYGSEYYCTLSYIEVYGVDAVEKMLEDLIVVSHEKDDAVSLRSEPSSSERDEAAHSTVDVPIKGMDGNESKNDGSKGSLPHPLKEVKQQLSGRMPSDAVLKILMQKVSSLELSLSVLEEYLKELNRRYGYMLPDIHKELSQNALLLEKTKLEVEDLMEWKASREKEISELKYWKSAVSVQLDVLIKDNSFLRANVERIQSNQEILENHELAVLSVNLFFAFLALCKLAYDRILMLFRTCESEKACRTNTSWLLILLSSSMTTLIALLYN